ncbi:MAG: hypothetical protein WD066_13640 [Planctomycetaceae bacterium]
MAEQRTQDRFRLGFLTAVRIGAGGHVGGLLVTNRQGRPLEFQCTTPVRPNRTQEILYGPTLLPFVLGELIGKTLVERVGVKPDLLLVEGEDFLGLREHVAIPVGCVLTDESPAAEQEKATLGRQSIRVHPDFTEDRAAVGKAAESVPADADLLEPFERVREALKETLTAGAA